MYGGDLELMALVAAGDACAQRTLVERLMRRTQRLALVLLRQRADASDASQTSLLEILRSAHTYRGDSPLERWADRIVVRTSLRLAGKRRRVVDGDSEALAIVAATPDESPLVVEAYLRGLPGPQRVAVILRHVYDCSVDEIADLTGVSPNTVKDRLLRGRETIRRSIRREDLRVAPVSYRAGQR
jgi:RNA polymerase sigma-70 factor (ECF subfamily)